MSTESYSKWWIKTRENFKHLRGYEESLKKMGAIKGKLVVDQIVGGLFARYSLIVQELDSCLDQMCQVQKNETIQKLMDAAVMRLYELKHDLMQIDISEYHYIDGALVELKLIPHSVEIIHPTYVHSRHHELEDFWRRIKNGETIFVPPPPPPPGEEGEEEGAPGAQEEPVDPIALLMGTKKEKKVEAVPVKEEEKKEEAKKEGEEEMKEDEPPPEPLTAAERKKARKEKKAKEKDKEKAKKARPKGFNMDISEMTEEQIAAMKKKQLMLEILTLVQSHERGRQCRLYFFDLNTDHATRKAMAVPGHVKPPPVDPEVRVAAATTIQSAYRAYLVRKTNKRREIERRLLIGMVHPSYKSTEEFDKFERNLEKRRAIREQHAKEYIQEHLNETARVLRVRGPGLFEDIGDEIREWFQEWYDVAQTFQDIPPAAKGGTVLVVRGETKTIGEFLLDKRNKKKQKKKSKEEIAKEKAKAKEKKRKEKERKKKEADLVKKMLAKKKQGAYEFKVDDTEAHEKYARGEKEMRDIWDNIDETENPLDKHYTYMITEEKCHDLQLEVRKQVDEMMRVELQMLKIAQKRQAWLKKHKGKGKFKMPKMKKPKKKKGKKGKKKKDPTGHRPVEDLFQELVTAGIIHTYPEVHMRDFRGDFSYQNWEKRMQLYDPPPTLGDVRQTVVLNCILPLGAENMTRAKSALIVGARQSGKHLLANAVFNETRCVLFDLSPPIVADKYPGGKGAKMLVHLVTKMARLLQPSIIFVDGAEKPFYKKVPKEEKAMQPKRVAKFLKPIVKFIKPSDRILLLGISAKPFAGSFGGMKKTFQKIILIPRTDYGSAYIYWNEVLMPYQGVDRNFNASALAIATINYPLSEIRGAVERVLVPKRLIQLSFKPLLHTELLDALLDGVGPVTDKEYKKFAKFYRKSPMGKLRAKMNVANEIAREKLQRGGKRK